MTNLGPTKRFLIRNILIASVDLLTTASQNLLQFINNPLSFCVIVNVDHIQHIKIACPFTLPGILSLHTRDVAYMLHIGNMEYALLGWGMDAPGNYSYLLTCLLIIITGLLALPSCIKKCWVGVRRF